MREIILDKEQIWAIFLFEFKMGREAAETTCNISHAFRPGTNILCSSGSRSFAKEKRALKISVVASNLKLTATNWEDRRCWSSYSYMKSCQRTHHWPFCHHLAFEAKWKGEKTQEVGATWTDRKAKKVVILKCRLILYNNSEPFFNQIVTCNEKWILYDNQQWLAQWLNQE